MEGIGRSRNGALIDTEGPVWFGASSASIELWNQWLFIYLLFVYRDKVATSDNDPMVETVGD